MIDKELKEAMDLTSTFLEKVPTLMDKLVKEFANKYRDEELVKKYVNCIIAGKTEEADKLLKILENGE